jgi:hypothetical protein
MKLNRQLNEVETRIYAAGMAARRRGEVRPADCMPPESYKIWRAGWQRVGRKLYGGNLRSADGETLVQSPHMIRTEVADFDDALMVIAREQRNARISATTKNRPSTWQEELKLANGRKKLQEKRERPETALLPHTSGVSEMERRLVERLMAATDMLTWSVNEMSNLSAIHRFFPQIGRRTLIEIIEKLCKLLNRPIPDFTIEVRPSQIMRMRRCVSCDVELRPQDEKYCIHCTPPDERIKIVSEHRRKRTLQLKGMRSEARSLEVTIRGAEKAIENAEGDSGFGSGDPEHSRHSGENIRGLEAGGRAKNLDRRGTPADRIGADDPGDVESRDRGGPFVAIAASVDSNEQP